MAEADAEASQSGQDSGNEILVPLDSNDPALFDFGDGTAIQAAAESNPPDPDDYPEYEDTVTVVVTFDTYMDGGYEYCTLRNARLL